MDALETTRIKREGDFELEEFDSRDQPEGFLPPVEYEVPKGFERAEWENLTNVLITRYYNSQG